MRSLKVADRRYQTAFPIVIVVAAANAAAAVALASRCRKRRRGLAHSVVALPIVAVLARHRRRHGRVKVKWRRALFLVIFVGFALCARKSRAKRRGEM